MTIDRAIRPITGFLAVTAVAFGAACKADRTDATISASAGHPADAFMSHLAENCGRAFAGHVAVDEPETKSNPFAGQYLIMHVSDCDDDELRIPFHVGEDRSRTWILTRTPDGLRLKHDHRHEDGTDDAVTMYGGETEGPGTESRQEFPVDAESVELFERESLAASLNNVWAMEIEPGQLFVYELARPGSDRLFRVEFDLSKPVDEPPAPW